MYKIQSKMGIFIYKLAIRTERATQLGYTVDHFREQRKKILKNSTAVFKRPNPTNYFNVYFIKGSLRIHLIS